MVFVLTDAGQRVYDGDVRDSRGMKPSVCSVTFNNVSAVCGRGSCVGADMSRVSGSADADVYVTPHRRT